MLANNEPLTDDLFMGLSNTPMNAPFDFQMMNYQETETYNTDMNFDLGTGFLDDYSQYINDS